MPALTEADVVVTLVDKDFFSIANVLAVVDVAFGDGSKTYPSGGIPLGSVGKFGFNQAIKFVSVEDAHNDGYVRKVDRDNMKLRIYQAGSHAHDLKIKGGAAPAEAIGVSGAGSDTLSKEAATDRTIAGAASATKGGVLAASASALSEVTTAFAPAAQVVRLLLIGC